MSRTDAIDLFLCVFSVCIIVDNLFHHTHISTGKRNRLWLTSRPIRMGCLSQSGRQLRSEAVETHSGVHKHAGGGDHSVAQVSRNTPYVTVDVRDLSISATHRRSHPIAEGLSSAN